MTLVNFMNKINLIVPFLKAILLKPSVVLKAIYHAIIQYDREQWVIKYFNLPHGFPQVDLLDLFPEFKETVDPFTNLYGTSLPIDLAVLKLFAKKYSNCDYLEIGTWRGESIANLAPICNHCVSISLSNNEMGSFGWGEPFQKLQRLFSKNIKNVLHIEANSRSMDFSKLNQKFDLVFIDGDHSFEGVKSDSEKVFGLLRDKDSVIVWHDYTSNYEHINWEVFAGILAGVPANMRGSIYHISNTLCAVYTNELIPTKPFVYPAFPDKNFIINISAKRRENR